MNSLTVSPAYGRDYATANEAMRAWWEGKDFRIEAESNEYGPTFGNVGRYVSCHETQDMDVWIRYAQLTIKIHVTDERHCAYCAHPLDDGESHAHANSPNPLDE